VAITELGRLLGLAGDVRIHFNESPALIGNAFGDPAVRPLAVYEPPGFDPQGSRRYAVIYVLHGYTGDVAASVSARPWETNVLQWADRLLSAGELRPVLVVLVDGNNRLGGSQYVDSIGSGAYATHVVRDTVAFIDATYPTLASEGGRAVAGKSSGGFGAMHLAMNYPGTFCAFASHSGDANFRGAYIGEFARTRRLLEAHGRDPRAFVEAFERKHKRSTDEMHAIMLLGQAAAYSPRSSAAFDFDLPFDLDSGALREDVFARWLAFDPAERCVDRAPELGRLRLRYLDCGRRDEYALDVGARVVAGRLREMGLAVHHEEFDDDHRNVGYRYAVSLPALARVMEAG
jgi:enterochelin esterase family protein